MITSDTTLTIGLAIALMSAAVAWGVQWQKTKNLEERLARVEMKLDNLMDYVTENMLKKSE